MNDSPSYKHSEEDKNTRYHFSAFSLGSVAARRMTKGVIGHVHSIFRRVINIEIPDEGLISLVGQEIGRGPLYISVEMPEQIDLTAIGVDRNHTALRADNLVRVSENLLAISLENARLWEPEKKFSNILDVPAIEANLAALQELVVRFGNHSDLIQLLEFSKKPFEDETTAMKMNPVSRLALPQVMKLLDAIEQGNSQNIVQSGMNLIGLGPGLTPAVDDFLVGLILSMSYIAENLNFEQIPVQDAIKDLASCIQGRTTTISEEFLLQAVIGNANESVIALIEALLTSDQVDLVHPARKVMDFGGTSGTDMVLGILFGANMMLKYDL
ncbi:MAG: DUF2877 domain-containing protein [Candidatus Thorarchaeota archaeon]|jgi:hypothetical protein